MVLDGIRCPKIENVGIRMMVVMNIILISKEDRQMVETSMLLVIRAELNHLVQIDTRTEMTGTGNIAPDTNETEMIPQVVVVTEMTDIMITGKNTGVMMIVEDPGTKESRILPFLFIPFLNSFIPVPIVTVLVRKLQVYYRRKMYRCITTVIVTLGSYVP